MRAAAICFLLLAGCATTEVPRTIEVKVPVAVFCIDRPPVKPAFVKDSELGGMTNYQMVLALWVDRIKRVIYESEMEAAITACVKEKYHDD